MIISLERNIKRKNNMIKGESNKISLLWTTLLRSSVYVKYMRSSWDDGVERFLYIYNNTAFWYNTRNGRDPYGFSTHARNEILDIQEAISQADKYFIIGSDGVWWYDKSGTGNLPAASKSLI